MCTGGGQGQAEAAGDALLRPETQYVPLVLIAAAEADTCRNLDGRAASVDAKATANNPIWKTIALGTFKNARALREALRAAHCGIGDLAAEILYGPAFVVSKARTDVDLVVLSVAALGFGANGASLADIYARAGELGFELCAAEVAPQLRLQYLDQPLGEFLFVAMEAVATSFGEVAYLIVGNGGAGLLLIAGSGPADQSLAPTVRFVFARPRMIADPR